MKVRIRATPEEQEIDGLNLHLLRPDTVVDVSATLGVWLIAQGYADPEMRSTRDPDEAEPSEDGPGDQGRRWSDRSKSRE